MLRYLINKKNNDSKQGQFYFEIDEVKKSIVRNLYVSKDE